MPSGLDSRYDCRDTGITQDTSFWGDFCGHENQQPRTPVPERTMSSTLSAQEIQRFQDEGYLIIPGLLSEADVERVFAEITAVMAQRPDVPEDLIQYEPCMRDKDHTQTNELHVRKLFRMAKHLTFFRELAQRPALLQTARDLLGPQVALVQTMLLMKPPEISGPKVWHQDNGYFALRPPHCFGFWIACDPATEANGCMHIVPGSQRAGLQPHAGPGDEFGLVEPPAADILPVPMQPGDALLFHCELFHYTPANRTTQRRRALQYHYMAADVVKTPNQFPWEPELDFETPGQAIAS